MTREEIRTRTMTVLVDQLSNFGRAPTEVTDATRFVEDLGMDSLDRVELVMALEDEFDAEISDDDADSLPTFGDVLNFLAGYLSVSA